MYKDRNGKRIKIGSIVASAITINHETFKGFNFSTTICKKRGRNLVLDGVHGFVYLSDAKPKELCVIDSDSDMRDIYFEFAKDFPREKYK